MPKKRSKPLLDSYDLKILSKLTNKNYGVMELNKQMGLKHNSLKLHIDKLNKAGLIKKSPVPKSRKIILSTPKNNKMKQLINTLSRL